MIKLVEKLFQMNKCCIKKRPSQYVIVQTHPIKKETFSLVTCYNESGCFFLNVSHYGGRISARSAAEDSCLCTVGTTLDDFA